MKHLIPATLLMIASFSLFGQQAIDLPDSKLRIGAGFSPNYSYRTLKGTTDQAQTAKELRNEIELPKFGYSAGISLVYEINPLFALETGVFFTDRGEKIEALDVGSVNQSEPVGTVDIVYHYQYLDIPIKANYYFIQGRIKVFASAGVSVNLLVNEFNKPTVKYYDGTTNKHTNYTNNLEPFNLQLLIGAGIEYYLSEKFNIRIEPLFRRSVISVVDASLKQYPYSLGANITLWYKFSGR